MNMTYCVRSGLTAVLYCEKLNGNVCRSFASIILELLF